MKYLSIIILLCFSCSNDPVETKKNIIQLESTQSSLTNEVNNLIQQKQNIESNIQKLREDEKVLSALKEDKQINYILTVSIRQVSYSLNIRKQIADAVNEENFEIKVDKDSYERANIGDDLFNSFRIGSALMHSSLGSWRLKIVNKRIQT